MGRFCAGAYHSIGGGKSPVPVWFAAWAAIVKFTGFPRRRPTRAAWNGQYLLRRQVLHFHVPHYVRSRSGKQFNFALYWPVKKAKQSSPKRVLCLSQRPAFSRVASIVVFVSLSRKAKRSTIMHG